MNPAKDLEDLLHAEIPLTRAIGIRVAAYDGGGLRLTAPLTPNVNHKLTAFGGSLYSLAVVCGWGLIYLKVAEAGLHKHIVIQESSIRYLRPVTSDMMAECRIADEKLEHFLHTLQRHDRARLALNVAIDHGAERAVEFSGRYVVHG